MPETLLRSLSMTLRFKWPLIVIIIYEDYILSLLTGRRVLSNYHKRSILTNHQMNLMPLFLGIFLKVQLYSLPVRMIALPNSRRQPNNGLLAWDPPRYGICSIDRVLLLLAGVSLISARKTEQRMIRLKFVLLKFSKMLIICLTICCSLCRCGRRLSI